MDTSVTAGDLPLLGEPFAVEVANSDYAPPELDFFSDDLIGLWFAHVALPVGLDMPESVARDAAAALRNIRDATRVLLGRIADGLPPAKEPAAVGALNAAARRAQGHMVLEVGGDADPSWALHYAGRTADVVVAQVAGACISFLGGEQVNRVRLCARPLCPMFFVQHHKARRYCHESCAHSVRQARYYQRVRGR